MGIVLGLAARRIQFTLDLMPFDILGSEVLEGVVAKAAIGSVIFGQEGVVVLILRSARHASRPARGSCGWSHRWVQRVLTSNR